MQSGLKIVLPLELHFALSAIPSVCEVPSSGSSLQYFQ